MQLAQETVDQNQQSQNKESLGHYCKVERTSGVIETQTSWSGRQWYHVDGAGSLKRFSHYENSCGQKLYRNGKAWGEWKEVSSDKILYLYSGEQGLGVYDSEGSCLKTLSKMPNQKGIVTADLYDQDGQRVYHKMSQTFYGDGHRDAIIQIGPPPGLENHDSAPLVSANPNKVHPYDADPPLDTAYFPPAVSDEDATPSPSDLPARQLQKIESEYKPTTATVIDSEYVNNCGRRMYNLSMNQKVWERSGAEETQEGAPSIEITAEEIAAGSKSGEYTIVENEHGIFRIKDGEVQRKAVVARENWTSGHCECRCVPVRGFLGRVRYRRQSVWVEKSYSAVRLGWVDDPAVGIKSIRRPYDGYHGQANRGNGLGTLPGNGNGYNESGNNNGNGTTTPDTKSVSPFVPSSIPNIQNAESPIQSVGNVKQFQPAAIPNAGTDPFELNPTVPLAKEAELDLEFGTPPVSGSSSPSQETKPDVQVAGVTKKTPPPVEKKSPTPLEEIQSGGVVEQQKEQDLHALKPVEEKPESEQSGAEIETLPLEEDRPSIKDSPDGNPDSVPLRPWDTPKPIETKEPERIAKEEPPRKVESPLELDSITLPRIPKRRDPAQMVAALELVGMLQQVEHYTDMASRASTLAPGMVDPQTGLSQQQLVAYVANAGFNPNAYDRLHHRANMKVGQTPAGTVQHEWFSAVQKTLTAKLGDVMGSEQLLPNGAPDTAKLYNALTENREQILGVLENGIANGDIDIDAILDWARTSEAASQFYKPQLEKLEDYRFKGGWEPEFEKPDGNIPPGMPGGSHGPLA